jgi:hypothetical protein
MRPVARLFAAAVALVAIEASAGTLVTPPLPIASSISDRAICNVVNGGRAPIGPFTITLRRLNGEIVESTTVDTLAPGVSALQMSDGGEIQTASSVSCTVEGKGISKRTPVSLCRMPAADYVCGAIVQAP